MDLLDQSTKDDLTRSQQIAALFKFVHRAKFEEVARRIEIRPGVIEWVNRMRREGFMVGLVSDSYYVAAEVIRRRIFADFALAHVLHFDGAVCAGTLRINPAFEKQPGYPGAPLCKSHVIRRFREDFEQPAVDEVWSLGDNLNDLEMLRQSDQAFLIDPKHPLLARESDARVVESFAELLTITEQRWPTRASMSDEPGSPKSASANGHAMAGDARIEVERGVEREVESGAAPSIDQASRVVAMERRRVRALSA
jgi:phosphoserine phosphatase